MPDSEVWSCDCDSKTTTKPSVELFQDAKKYAEKHLLKHNVQIEYSAKSKKDYYGRYLVSVYYDCNKESNCKSYEEEILKAGYAFIYKYSNHRKLLKPFLNTDKIHKNAEKTKKLDLVVLNKKNNLNHEIGCDYAWSIQKYELIKRPFFHFKKHPASCCHDVKPHHKELKHKPYKKKAIANASESSVEIYFLSPLEQKKPKNKCTTNACKNLVYNIDHAQNSIDFAIYGIRQQDEVFVALRDAQKRGVKIRWVTD